MPALDVPVTINQPLPSRPWTRPYTITPSDTNTDRNLMRDGRPYRYIQNVGSGGLVPIVWEPSGDVVSLHLNQGVVIEGGHWSHVRSTGLGAGVSLVGLVGMEARD